MATFDCEEASFDRKREESSGLRCARIAPFFLYLATFWRNLYQKTLLSGRIQLCQQKKQYNFVLMEQKIN